MNIIKFVEESNRIEGINTTTEREVFATQAFIELDNITVRDVQTLVAVLQPGAILRDKPGLNVRVGNHIPPEGGPEIKKRLDEMLYIVSGNFVHSYLCHQAYETLHPFTDGNGRSGRAIWLWQMTKAHVPVYNSSFLQTWYYQSLQHPIQQALFERRGLFDALNLPETDALK